MRQLFASKPLVHLRCHPSEERPQRQQSQGHLRAQGTAEAVRRCTHAEWPDRLPYSPRVAHLRTFIRSSHPGADRSLLRLLLPPDVSDNAHPAQRTGAEYDGLHGSIGRGVLPPRRSVFFHAHSARHCCARAHVGGRVLRVNHQSQDGCDAHGRSRPGAKKLRLYREPYRPNSHHILLFVWMLLRPQQAQRCLVSPPGGDCFGPDSRHARREHISVWQYCGEGEEPKALLVAFRY